MAGFGYPEHYADDVWEAIELAERLCAEGEFDIFRGQRRNYPIVPSALRDGVDRDQVASRLNEFASWVHQTRNLSSLHGDIDAIVAVAQHYGLATPLT